MNHWTNSNSDSSRGTQTHTLSITLSLSLCFHRPMDSLLKLLSDVLVADFPKAVTNWATLLSVRRLLRPSLGLCSTTTETFATNIESEFAANGREVPIQSATTDRPITQVMRFMGSAPVERVVSDNMSFFGRNGFTYAHMKPKVNPNYGHKSKNKRRIKTETHCKFARIITRRQKCITHTSVKTRMASLSVRSFADTTVQTVGRVAETSRTPFAIVLRIERATRTTSHPSSKSSRMAAQLMAETIHRLISFHRIVFLF